MLDVLGDAGRIAISPFREYLVAVGETPVDKVFRPG